MKTRLKALALTSATLSLLASSAQAASISIGTALTDINFTAVGGLTSAPVEGDRDASQLVDGSGVTVNDSGQSIVLSANPNGLFANTTTQTAGLLIDLGSVQNISALQIFNFHDATGNSDFGPASFDLYTATDTAAVDISSGSILVSDLGLFTQVSDDTPLVVQAGGSPGIPYLGETYLFGTGLSAADQATIGDQTDGPDSLSADTITARYIFLDDLTGTDRFGGRTGFSEIQVFSETIPEPSSTALLGLGGLALILRRRR